MLFQSHRALLALAADSGVPYVQLDSFVRRKFEVEMAELEHPRNLALVSASTRETFDAEQHP